MKWNAKRLLALLLAIILLPAWGLVPAYAAGKGAMGVEVGMTSYALDLNRIYQGGRYDAAIKIGENLSFTGTLNEGLSDEMLQKCINEALADEHLRREDIIETNKMVAELLQRMKQPQDFWAELDFYSDLLGIRQYTDTAKHMAGSATHAGEGLYQGLSAQERQFVQEQLGKTMGESFDQWKSGLTDVGAKIKDKVTGMPISMAEEALSTNVIGTGYKVLSGVWKAMQRNIEQEKDLKWLKEMALKRSLVVEAFYKRAGAYVKDYLKEYGQWQLRIDGAKDKNARVEQMTKLNFDCGQLNGTLGTFYTIQPIKLTWSADAYFIKDDHSENPNGTYTGRIMLTGEYDTSTLKSHLIPLVQKFEQFSLAESFSLFDENKMEAFERSRPSVKQIWRVEQCQIEVMGLSENGAASIQLPELVEERSITMDYEIVGSHTASGVTYSGYDEIATPEHCTQPLLDLPESYDGEMLNWVQFNQLASTATGSMSGITLNETMPAEPDDSGQYGTAFVIRAPFEGWTGYKRIEITKAK